MNQTTWRRHPIFALVMAVVTMLGATSCWSDEAGDPVAFCAAVSDQGALDDIFDDLEPTEVADARARFEAALAAERRLRSEAPEAVRRDIDVLIRFFEDLVAGLTTTAASDTASADTRPVIYDELRPRFDQVEAASDRIALYVGANC